MKVPAMIALVALLILSTLGAQGTIGHAQAQDPCTGLLEEGEVGLDYKGHCIIPDPAKGPVQGIFVRRVEDLDAVTLDGIVLMHTDKGWVLVPEEFVTPITNDYKTVAVEDGWHMVVEKDDP
jgi:hypothetical protein